MLKRVPKELPDARGWVGGTDKVPQLETVCYPINHTDFSKTYQICTGSSRWGPSTERGKWTQGPVPNQEPICSL